MTGLIGPPFNLALYVWLSKEVCMLGKLFGIICLAFGIILGSWVSYNLLFDIQPAAEGRNPITPLMLTFGLLYVGITRLKKEPS